jgi:tetratricopeptide (TPR) repeat protein
MNRQTALFALSVCVAVRTVAWGQTPDPEACKDADFVQNQNLVIDACSVLIDGWQGERDRLAELLIARGNAYYDKGLSDSAIADFGQAIMLNPLSAEAHYGEGSAYAQKDRLDLALKEYNEAIRLNPKYIRAYNNRGYVYFQKGDVVAAFRDFSKAIDLNPSGSAWIFANRGEIFLLMGDCTRALHDFAQAQRLNPKYAIPETASSFCSAFRAQ